MVEWRSCMELFIIYHNLSGTKTIQAWETAGRTGILTANLMWPGPPVTINGISHAYFVPFKVFWILYTGLALISSRQDKYPLDAKVQQIVVRDLHALFLSRTECDP